MRNALSLVSLMVLFTGCLEKKTEEKPPEESFIQSMPIKDRDLLLEPLEGVLDDLKTSIENDPSLFASDRDISVNGVSGKLAYRLNGKDTSMLAITLGTASDLRESHAWYFDKAGGCFYSEHEIAHIEFGVDKGLNHRQYRFYFDENGSKLSSYARISFNGEPLPERWSAVKLTPQEERYLRTKKTHVSQQGPNK
ncbi:MAG: hypothetical protein Salg2KO_21360 [Salibacteraceae bacterium]